MSEKAHTPTPEKAHTCCACFTHNNMPCEDEQEIHAALTDHRLDGRREFYHPTAEVLAVVNAMRESLNMPPLAA